MMVADSSYLCEGILRNATLLERNAFIAPDLALYEVANTLWKHEVLIGDLKDSSVPFDLLWGLISAGAIQLVRPDERLLKHTRMLSVKYGKTVYDTVFVALALELGLELKTFDGRQKRVFFKEREQ